MDPPSEGCPLCGSTWGNHWEDVDGRATFFCCELCAREWLAVLREVTRRTGWPRCERVTVLGNRWGRTGEARFGEASYQFQFAFTPEGRLRRFLVTPGTPPAADTAASSAPLPEPMPTDLPAPPPDLAAPGPEVPSQLAGARSPEAVAEAVPGPAPDPIITAVFNEEIRAQIAHESDAYPDLTTLPPEEGRKVVRQMARETDGYAGPVPSVSQLKTTSFGPSGQRVPVRVYSPKDGESPFPVIAYFHGGGWVFGDLDTHDSVCREIANRSECVVASVGYRRAPEHRYPTAVEDCYAALQWLSDEAVAARLGTDPSRIAVAGDSVGGNLAAVVSLLARERSGPKLSGQVLICPVTAYYPETPSYTANAKGYGFEGSFMPWMWEQYLRTPEDGKDPHVAPLNESDLAGLPPALVITAEYDLLRDEGEAYARGLRDAGVPTQATRYPGMPHGFIDYRGLAEAGWDALDEIGAWARARFVR